MSDDQLAEHAIAELSRRSFISVLGAFAGTSMLGITSGCAGDATRVSEPSLGVGSVRGMVVNASDAPQSIGRIYLLQKSGLNTGVFADVDGSGRFTFDDVKAGEYQVRYWGANRAQVPEELPNPVRITVDADTPTVVRFQIVLADHTESRADQDIYAGDNFFQEQPVGTANGAVVVELGTLVCWYNVGSVPHTVTGGPWGDSGPISLAGSYMWLADQLGTFLYSCRYHQTQMVATLQVVNSQ